MMIAEKMFRAVYLLAQQLKKTVRSVSYYSVNEGNLELFSLFFNASCHVWTFEKNPLFPFEASINDFSDTR